MKKIIVDPQHPSNDPTTIEAFINLIEEALFEIGDTRASMEYDMEGVPEVLSGFIDELELALKRMKTLMEEGDYEFGDQDLPFMKLVAKQDVTVLPFKRLLEDINRIHRNGLSLGE